MTLMNRRRRSWSCAPAPSLVHVLSLSLSFPFAHSQSANWLENNLSLCDRCDGTLGMPPILMFKLKFIYLNLLYLLLHPFLLHYDMVLLSSISSVHFFEVTMVLMALIFWVIVKELGNYFAWCLVYQVHKHSFYICLHE
jgi:hypothetical protein